MRLHLVILEGQGDTVTALFDDELWDWLMLPELRGRQNGENGWFDPETPQRVIDEIGERPMMTIGSWQNDRAMAAYAAAPFNEYGEPATVEAMKWAADHGHTVEGEYHGCIY